MQQTEVANPEAAERAADRPNWLGNATLLWERRLTLLKTAALGLVASALIVLLIPNRYESTARIMPPESASAGTAVLAALAGRGGGELSGMGGLAASLLGVRTTGPLFVDLLRSGTISSDLIDRFDLERVYRKRYRMDAAKKLAHRTSIAEDKKSGVIVLTVEDSDPRRARDMAQAYLDELNMLVTRTNASSAHQEREFIEHRLVSAESELEEAQKELSDFSSTHATIDIKEQTRATVDAAAKLQAELIVEQSELDSLKQIYGDENFRVRGAVARIGDLRKQLKAIGGTSAPLTADGNIAEDQNTAPDRSGSDYPPLRQIPRLAVPYSDMYRRVRVQEAVYELLTQQFELARIQEAKDVPVVRVIDFPGIPEKKSFPPRTILALVLTALLVLAAAACILAGERWHLLDEGDPRKRLASRIGADLTGYRVRLGRAREYGR